MKYLEESTGKLIPLFTFEEMKETYNKLNSAGIDVSLDLLAPRFIDINWFIDNADDDDKKALYFVDDFSPLGVTFMLLIEECMENVIEM